MSEVTEFDGSNDFATGKFEVISRSPAEYGHRSHAHHSIVHTCIECCQWGRSAYASSECKQCTVDYGLIHAGPVSGVLPQQPAHVPREMATMAVATTCGTALSSASLAVFQPRLAMVGCS